MRLGRLLLCGLLLAAGVTPAGAAEPTGGIERQARGLFQRGELHFRAGLFAEALAEYQAGYDLFPLPGFLINIAQCHRRLGHLDQALVTYRTFLMVAPDSRFVPQVRSLIAELEQLVRAAEPAGGKQEGGDDVPAAPSLPQPLPTAPVTEERPANAPLLAQAAPSAAPARPRSRWWLWTGLAVVAAGATAALFAFRAPEATTLHEGSLGTLRR